MLSCLLSRALSRFRPLALALFSLLVLCWLGGSWSGVSMPLPPPATSSGVSISRETGQIVVLDDCLCLIIVLDEAHTHIRTHSA